MNSNQWIKRFRKLWYMPSTPEGNPLYKRSEETNDKNILKIAETDKDYDKMISKTWTSPSNVRAIFIGVNKAFILFHRGLSEGSDSKKVLEVNVKGEEWIYPIPGIVDGSNSLYYIDLKHCSKDPKTNLPIPDPDKSKYETFNVEKDPLGSSINRFIFSNLETVLVSWTALSVSNFNNAGALKDYIKELSNKSKRWQGAYYIKDNADEFLGKYEQNIRDFAKEKFKTIEEFIPEISQYQIDKAENNLKQNLSLQPKQWPYDNFLAGWNTSLAKEDFENKQNKEENKSEDDLKDLVCLNKGFLANYKGNNGIEVQKRDDYTVKISLCEPGKKYYNDLEDVYYESNPSKVVITGTASEQWLTKPQKVIDTYVKLDGSPITKEDFINLGKGTLEVKPKSNSDKCFAYHIPADQRDKFYIATSWGDNLKINATYAKGAQNRINHGDGDWVICYSKDGKPNLEDQSVINGLIFRNTYKKYEEQPKEEKFKASEYVRKYQESYNLKKVFERLDSPVGGRSIYITPSVIEDKVNLRFKIDDSSLKELNVNREEFKQLLSLTDKNTIVYKFLHDLRYLPSEDNEVKINIDKLWKQFEEKLFKIEGYDQLVGTIGSDGFDFKYGDHILTPKLKEDGLFHFSEKDKQFIGKYDSISEYIHNDAISPEDMLIEIENSIDKILLWIKKNHFNRITVTVDNNKNKIVRGIVNPENNKIVYILRGRESYGFYYNIYNENVENISSEEFKGKIEDVIDDYKYNEEYLDKIVKPKLLTSQLSDENNLELIAKKVWESINEDKDENYFEKINDRKYLITDNGEATYEFISDKENKKLLVRIDESEESSGQYKTIYGPKKFEEVNINEIIYNISKFSINNTQDSNDDINSQIQKIIKSSIIGEISFEETVKKISELTGESEQKTIDYLKENGITNEDPYDELDENKTKELYNSLIQLGEININSLTRTQKSRVYFTCAEQNIDFESAIKSLNKYIKNKG